MSIFLGVDIGTSGTKTIAMDATGKVLAQASAGYPCHHPKPLWSEQDPDDWWRATVKTIRAVVKQARLKPADVKGIGLSGQMHGSVFLDKSHQVIRPALLWNDGRTAAECEEIERRAGGRKRLIKLVANPALTGFQAPKILWLRNNEPKNFDKLAQVLLPKDDVRRRLTGELATEVSDASGTLLLDVVKRDWSEALLSKLELDPALLPKCYRIGRGDRQAAAGGRQAAGALDRLRGGRRGGGLRGRGGGQRRRQEGGRAQLARHVGRRVLPQRHARVRPRGPAAHLLPRGARQVAHDGRHALGRRLVPVVRRCAV